MSIVAKETAVRKADTGVKCSVADSHLLRECLAAVGGFTDEILPFGVKRAIAVIIPAHVYRATRRRSRPSEEVIFAIIKGVIVNTVNRGCVGQRVHDGKVNAGSALDFTTSKLTRREGAIGSITMDSASRGVCAEASEAPLDVVQSVEHESRDRFFANHPLATF